MRRVLIPSDNRDFVAELARAYARLGWDAVVGRANFDLETGQFDLIHLQWPEELTGWESPTSAQIDEIARRLERWSQRAKLLLTVHNLHPHRQVEDASSVLLYEAVYDRVPVLLHFTETSRRQVCEHFPQAAKQRNLVTGNYNWDGLLATRHEGLPARERLGIWQGEFVVLIFGALREWPEVRLISQAFSAAGIPRKRLLMAGRYHEGGSLWRQRWRRWAWARWLRHRRAVVVDRFIPDEQVHQIIEAADVVVVPRLRALNSGLISLAATFGKPWIAPDCGAYPELSAGTLNPIYRAGGAASLARALERVAKMDRTALGAENRRLADEWTWERIVSAGLEAVGEVGEVRIGK